MSFYFDGDKVTNRFDKEETSILTDLSLDTEIAYRLFSWINNAVLCKGKGKECCKQGETTFQTLFASLEKGIEESKKESFHLLTKKASDTLSSFFTDAKPVSTSDLLEALAPLAVQSLANEEEETANDYFKALKKDKSVIFNQATMFIRSVFHAFLTLKGIIPSEIKQDSNFSNGIFFYQDQVIIPTTYNAYTIKGYKQIVLRGIDRISPSFPLEEIHKATVLYLAKDILVEYQFEK